MIWDAIFPPRVEEDKDVAVFVLTVRLGKEEVDAGGAPFPGVLLKFLGVCWQ